MTRWGPDWLKRAACKEHPDPDLWHRHESLNGRNAGGERAAIIAEARYVCTRCPVRQECADYALDTRQRHGIWGGLTREDRIRIWRLRQEQERMKGLSA